ncbi:DUF5783 family protein [Halobaculum litoreum]|uniref:DUF5783 family protein n=1 Tax=Halobaculum litoreum TaxID=3031998 RepID=UPI0024C3407C|nr:DUF5783 family protein [Halobaculum sp. DT92]
MAEFDPERFEDKYANYFPELQRAYKNAFEQMNERYDSELIHGIDQQILNESEPFYDEGSGRFTVELPENPTDRLTAIVVDDEKLAETLDRYVAQIETELYRVFDLEPPTEE